MIPYLSIPMEHFLCPPVGGARERNFQNFQIEEFFNLFEYRIRLKFNCRQITDFVVFRKNGFRIFCGPKGVTELSFWPMKNFTHIFRKNPCIEKLKYSGQSDVSRRLEQNRPQVLANPQIKIFPFESLETKSRYVQQQ